MLNRSYFSLLSSQLVRFLSLTLIFVLVLGNGSALQAQTDAPRAHPALLQLAAEHPDDTFMVIIERAEGNQDRRNDSAEKAVGRTGGRVMKQLQMIKSFSAELMGREIEALAMHPQVRWITFDAPLFSTAAGDPTLSKAIVTNKPRITLATVGTVYTVSNTNNSGAGSLRQAITDANAHAGADAISFSIAGTGVRTITLTSALPAITDPVVIDGYSQPGAAVNTLAIGNNAVLLIELNGAGITGAQDVLTLEAGSSGSTIRGLVINRGTDDGLTVNSSGNTIVGNFIGTNAAGTADLGNAFVGLRLNGTDSFNNVVGGTVPADRNIISGNNTQGLRINLGAHHNVIQGNYIGTNAAGTAAIANSSENVRIVDTGTDNNLIGGTAVGAGNIIAFSSGRGMRIVSGVGNSFLGNSIFSNGSLGIDLKADGVTANNGTKSGTLPNYGMDYPVITSASLSNCTLTVAGYVGSAANQNTFANARVEFFKAAADSSGYGEGQTFLSYLTTDASGNFSGIVSGIDFNAGDRLTATATDDSNNTSEFGPNFQVTTATGSCVTSPFAAVVRADQLPNNLQGQGITVAVVDSGITEHGNLQGRIVVNNNQTTAPNANDNYVHGTFVAGIIGGEGKNAGIAPKVNLVNVKVSNDVGNGTISDLVDGLQWILANKDVYNIKVVNISLNSTVPEPYDTSPLDAAVEILWFNGITVVVAAGNNGTGSGPVTLYPPANDPFVITVGATDDFGTPALNDDALATFSAYGTTEAGFAKPDLVAPGRNIISLLASTSAYGYINHPAHRVDTSYFRMSGTSMSAPMVSGAVALLLQDEPNLTPDQVKYRLKATANTAWPGYNAAKAGAGYLDAYAAVYGTTTMSANTGLAISNLLSTGSEPVDSSVSWNSVSWNSVSWNSVSWNSVSWNSVSWNAVSWASGIWDDALVNRLFLPLISDNSDMGDNTIIELTNSPYDTDIVDTPAQQAAEAQANQLFLPLINR